MKSKVKGLAKDSQKIQKLVYSGLFIALGILLPQTFHMFGPNAGMMFLPIQIPILLAGIILGPWYGGMVGLIVPILSSIFTGMPPVPKVYFMCTELVTYGVVTGMMKKRANIYVNLVASMICGRFIYGISLLCGLWILQMNAPFMNITGFISTIVSGIPGMMIQIIVIPFLYMRLKQGGFAFE